MKPGLSRPDIWAGLVVIICTEWSRGDLELVHRDTVASRLAQDNTAFFKLKINLEPIREAKDLEVP